MLADMEVKNPQAVSNMLKALTNVSPSQLADANLYYFKNLESQVSDSPEVVVVAEGPKLFQAPVEGERILFKEIS